MPRKGRKKRLEKVKALASFFSASEIARILGVSRATIVADMSFLKDTIRRVNLAGKERFCFLLCKYAELNAHILQEDFMPELARGFEMVLRVSEVLAALAGAQAVISAPPARDEIALAYHHFIYSCLMRGNLTARPQDPGKFWSDFLANIHAGAIPAISSPEELRDHAVGAYLLQEQEKTRPVWNQEVFLLVKEEVGALLATLTPKEASIIKRRFGLEAPPETLKKIGEFFGVSAERIRSIESQASRKLNRPMQKLHMLLLSSSNLLAFDLREIRKARMQEEMRSKIREVLASREIQFTSEQLEAMVLPVDEIEFSVRTWNCLKNAHVRYLGEIVQKTERELLMSRNFGRKTLNEVKEILSQFGLHLGMVFNEATRQAYEALKQR